MKFFAALCLTAVVAAKVDPVEKFREVEQHLSKFITSDPEESVKNLCKAGLCQTPNLKKSSLRKKRATSGTTDPTPVVQMHGMGDFAKDPGGMVPLANDISEYLGGAYVLNVQIGKNSIADIFNSFIMNLDDQVEYFANVVKSDPNLANGFNAVGYSQGNLVIRGYIERFNNPPVFNFISMHGPLAGVVGFPGCSLDRKFCKIFDEILGELAYLPFFQQHLAQANYLRASLNIEEYLLGDKFLAPLNNEVASSAVPEYNSNLNKLNSLCLVKALGDTVVVPNDSEWFGSFVDGSMKEIWGFKDTPWYINDYFGLKTLDISGKVFFNTTDGNHLDFDTDYLLDLVGIYFV